MEEIGRRAQTVETPLPCQYFDLIGGTSTGGLIAIMLGRLRMVFPIQLILIVTVR
jgi:patatin-like phospholipase/acyl hydrolase